MNKIYACIAFLLLFTSTAFAQAPAIEVYDIKPTCLNALTSISVRITGAFNPNNNFKVQLKTDYYSTNIIEVPATLNNNNIELRITDSTLSLQPSYYFRIVASSPYTESQWNSSFKVLSKGKLNISNYLPDSLNKNNILYLKLSGNSNSDVRITLNDSTKFFLSSGYDGVIDQSQQLLADKSTTYNIAHAENGCGKMAVSGAAKVYVNPVSVITTYLSPLTVCSGSELKINFSIQDGTLPASAKFKIRLLEEGSSSGFVPATIDIPATLKDNILTAILPEGFKGSGLFFFRVHILVDNPKIVGAAGQLRLAIAPRPAIIFTSPSKTIEMGETATLNMRYSGPNLFNVRLSDDSNIYVKNSLGTSIDFSANKKPLVTTEYSVKSIEAGCTPAAPNKQSVRLTVNPGLYLDQLDITKIYCEDETVKLHFVTNTTLNDGTSFSMLITENYFGKQISVPVKREGDFIEFKIPRFPNTSSGTRRSYVFQLIASNPSLKSFPTTGLTIQSVPTIQWSEYNKQTFPGPVTPNLGYTLLGGGPYSVELEDGRKSTFSSDGYGSANIYIPKSGAYGIRSVGNTCFKNESLPKINIQIENPALPSPFISIIPLGFRFCNGDSIEIDFNANGNFNEGNIFNLELAVGATCCNYQPFVTLNKTGKIKVKIPEDARGKSSRGTYSYDLRIASTNPVVFSERINLYVEYPLYDISVSYFGGRDDFFTPNSQSYGILKYLGGTATSAIVSNGKTDSEVNLNSTNQDNTFPINSTFGSNTFTVKTITSFCGTQTVNLVKSITVMPYDITIPSISYNDICAGSSILVPFVVENGDASKATFSLQIAKNGTSDFTNLVTGATTRSFQTRIPETYPDGDYILRVISSDNAISNSIKIHISVPAATELVLQDRPNTPTINIKSGETIYFKVNLSGSVPQIVTAYGLGVKDIGSPSFSYFVNPVKSGEFKLLSAVNACGYGKTTGVYKINVVPTLSVIAQDAVYCSGGSISINYSLTGDFDLSDEYIRFELINTSSQKRYQLDSTKNSYGLKILKFAASIPPGMYYLRTSIKKYDLKYDYFVDLATTPNVYITGNATINPGAQMSLAIKSRNSSGSQQVSFQLSDGTTGKFYENVMGTSVNVTPLKTTTYTITSVSNVCGAGVSSGSATVEVNPASDRSVDIKSWSGTRADQTCTGDSILVYFNQKGNFSAGNKFTVQVSDTTGANFRSITTVGTDIPLKAYFPADLLRGSGYRLRVIASDPSTASGTFKDFITLKIKPKARFSSEIVGYQANKNPKVTVLLEGDSPWNYTYGTDVSQYQRYSAVPIDSIELYQASPSAYYKLFKVSNVCGIGTIGTPSTIRVEVVTGTEDPILSEIKVFPNPTQDIISVTFENPSKKNITVFNLKGVLIVNKVTHGLSETIDISQYSSGIYILKVETGGRIKIFKIFKE